MRSLAHKPQYRFREYLELEEASSTKHEYYAGEIYAMAGGTPDHAGLSVAISSTLQQKLQGKPCRVFSSDLRVRVPATGLTTYPDVTVVCGDLQTDPESQTTVINPTVVVEVLSDSTEQYDRRDKFEHYKQIPSLQGCVFVSHRECLIEVHTRAKESWSRKKAGPGEVVSVPALTCEIDVNTIYRDTNLNKT